jgi:hypothetical protein
MNVTETLAFMRERLFAADVAETIEIDGANVVGHLDEHLNEEDFQSAHMGVFLAKVTLVLPPGSIGLPVPGQQMMVNGRRVTVTQANEDGVAMTIAAMRNAA